MQRNPIVDADYRRLLALDLPWQLLHGRTVLVTGASGFIGGHLADLLAFINESQPAANIRVIALARSAEKLHARLPWLTTASGVETCIADVCADLPDAPTCDFILHAASPASPTSYLRQPVDTLLANIDGTRRLLELARGNSARLLFLSSGTVYGNKAGGSDEIGETDFGGLDPLDPRACYGEGKRAGESLCAAYHAQYGVAAVIARISHTYGPGMALDDGRVVTDLLRDVLAGRDLQLRSDGMDSRPFCYIADLLAGLAHVLFKGLPGEAYNVGVSEETTILDLARHLAAQRHDLMLTTHANALAGLTPAARASGHFILDKIHALGWHPATPLAQGLARTYASYTS